MTTFGFRCVDRHKLADAHSATTACDHSLDSVMNDDNSRHRSHHYRKSIIPVRVPAFHATTTTSLSLPYYANNTNYRCFQTDESIVVAPKILSLKCRVERVAIWTLNPKKVPRSFLALGSAIIAQDIYVSPQLWRQGLLCNVPSACFPGCSHGLLRDNSLLTNGATVVEPSQSPEAMSMNGMSAGQVLW